MRRRLSIASFFLLFSSGLLCAFALISQQFLWVSLTEMQDKQLQALAAFVMTETDDQNGVAVPNPEDGDVALLFPGATVQVFDKDKKLLYQCGPKVLPSFIPNGFGNYYKSGTALRVLSRSLKGGLVIQMAIPDKERSRAIASYGEMLKLFLPVALILVCLSSYFFSGLVLAPIERSLEELRRYMVDVGHELRTPITIALSNVQAMQIDLGENKAERMDAAERAILRMKNLVEDLFLLARSENASVTFTNQELDLWALTRNVVCQYEESYAAKLIDLSCTGLSAIVRCDSQAVSRVIENLLENALRYTPEGGRVMVSVELRHNCARFCVADSGAGIPAQEQKKVFERFFRLEESRERHKGGAGLGLSIVKNVIECHGGRVWLESEVGIGSKFFFELPMSS